MKKRSLIVFLTTILRLLSALFIYLRPLEGMVVYILFDSFDTLLLEDMGNLTYKQYHSVDKVIDVATYLTLLPLGLKYGVFSILLMLLLFRVIGTLFFYFRRNGYYLILFPNFFLTYLFFIILVGERILIFSNYFLWIVILGQIFTEIVYHFIYPNYLNSGILRQILKLFGYNRKRVI